MVTWSAPKWASEDSSEPWPVSKYMTLGPSAVPWCRSSCRASSNVAAEKPKAAFPFSLPAMDWKIRSQGAPARTAFIWAVTWARTQIWVGMAQCSRISWNRRNTFPTCSGESVTGFRPITASPAPKLRPSNVDAVIPSGSSVVWLGCRRQLKVPGRPIVVLQWAVTVILLAA